MPKSALRALLVLLPAALLPAALLAGEEVPRYQGPVEAGLLAAPANGEASGLAASQGAEDLVWTHGDSGGEPVLYALGTDGALRGKVRLGGVANEDWEDIASGEIDGKPVLLVADTGDQFAQRSQPAIHVVLEPDPAQRAPGQELALRPAYSIYFKYEDGARDTEAVAVDPKDRAIYLLSKRDSPARLYRLPLQATRPALPAVARLVGTVPHLPQPAATDKAPQDPLPPLPRLSHGAGFFSRWHPGARPDPWRPVHFPTQRRRVLGGGTRA